MNRSLQWRLSKMLSLAVLIFGILASLVAFYFSYTEAQEFQDDSLRQIAALSVGTPSEIQQLDLASKTVEDAESLVQVVRLPEGPRPAWLPADIDAGFHTLSEPVGRGKLRAFVRITKNGGRLVAAQSTDSRDELALNSALRTLTPLLVLLPILIGLITFIVRSELTALRRLSEDVDEQAAERLKVLPAHGLPDEIVPFVQAINRLLERVDKMISEQRRFIADAAHELRTPLTALSLQAQNVILAESPESMRERLIPLQSGIDRARRLTVQLLDLARLQAGEGSMHEVDVQALARELIAEFHPLAEAKGIDIGIGETGLTAICSDPRALNLIIRNALENAIKYTPSGGEVTLNLRSTDDGALIEVVDSGPGISLADMGKVFNPFYRSMNSMEGSGLGLAIAKEAAMRVGGKVTLQNQEQGAGLIFHFSVATNSASK